MTQHVSLLQRISYIISADASHWPILDIDFRTSCVQKIINPPIILINLQNRSLYAS